MQDIFILIAISFPIVGKYQGEFVEKSQFRYNYSTVLVYHKFHCICAILMLFPLPELSSYHPICSSTQSRFSFHKDFSHPFSRNSISSFSFVLHCSSHISRFTLLPSTVANGFLHIFEISVLINCLLITL